MCDYIGCLDSANAEEGAIVKIQALDKATTHSVGTIVKHKFLFLPLKFDLLLTFSEFLYKDNEIKNCR